MIRCQTLGIDSENAIVDYGRPGTHPPDPFPESRLSEKPKRQQWQIERRRLQRRRSVKVRDLKC